MTPPARRDSRGATRHSRGPKSARPKATQPSISPGCLAYHLLCLSRFPSQPRACDGRPRSAAGAGMSRAQKGAKEMHQYWYPPETSDEGQPGTRTLVARHLRPKFILGLHASGALVIQSRPLVRLGARPTGQKRHPPLLHLTLNRCPSGGTTEAAPRQASMQPSHVSHRTGWTTRRTGRPLRGLR